MYTIKFKNGTIKLFKTLRGANLRGANLREADLEGADLQGADLLGANLRGADLRRADLQGADMQGANMQRADLEGADLQGADLQDTSISSFTLGRHFGFYHEGYLKIGCHGRLIDKWTDKFISELGNNESYTDNEIKKYRKQINLIKEFAKDE